MDAPESRPPDGRPVGRRVFLGMAGVGLSSLFWADGAFRAIADAVRPVSNALPESVRAALPAPSTGWRIYAVNPPMPTFDPASWRLRIDGLVDKPVELTFAQLRALPRAEQISDFHCVTGWSVPNVRWTGVRFADLLAEVMPQRAGTALNLVSAEVPYVDTLTLPQAMVSDAMLAYAMDGRPLTRAHGAPVRVVMPKMYGYKGVKWLSHIEVVARPQPGFWEQRGYDQDAWVGRSNGLG